MSKVVLSKTQFEPVAVLESTLRVAPVQPEPGSAANAELTLDTQDEPMVSIQENDERCWSKHLTLQVEVAIRSEIPESDELAKVRVVLSGGATSPGYDEILLDELDRHLSANIVSMLYGTARTHIELLTSMSPVQRVTLPAIDPYSVVDGED